MTDPEPSERRRDTLYVAAWRQRWDAAASERAALRDRRRLDAEAVLPAIVSLLVNDFGATRVWLTGSLARGDFDLHSDIDLAVEGVAPTRWFAAECAAARLIADAIPVEVVPVERARPRFLEGLRREGRLLHG